MRVTAQTACAQLGVGVVGLGVGEQHARAYLRTGYCQLRWLYDLDSSKAASLIDQLGGGVLARNFEEILNDPQVQIISIASYDDAHYEQLIQALRANKSVFVEKPLCRSFDELRMIQETWKKHGCPPLASNLVLRSAPLYQWLRQAIHDGEFGTLYAIDGDYLYGRIHKITDGWRAQVENYSVIQGGGIHMVDLMMWLTEQKPTTVSAWGNRICTTGTAFRYNDYVAATYPFSSGLIGRISAHFGCVHRHQHVLRVFGTKATLIYDDQGPRLYTNRDPFTPAASLNLSALPHSKGDQIPEFVRSVFEGRDMRAATGHEFDVMSACLSADAAVAQDRTIPIIYL